MFSLGKTVVSKTQSCTTGRKQISDKYSDNNDDTWKVRDFVYNHDYYEQRKYDEISEQLINRLTTIIRLKANIPEYQ